MVIFWIKKPSINPVKCGTNWKNIGISILLTGLVSVVGILHFLAMKYFLELDTIEFFVVIAVTLEAIVNLPLPILFINSNPNLKNFVINWFRSIRLLSPCFNVLIRIQRIAPSQIYSVSPDP